MFFDINLHGYNFFYFPLIFNFLLLLILILFFFFFYCFKANNYFRMFITFEIISLLFIVVFSTISYSYNTIDGEVFCIYIIGISSIETVLGLCLFLLFKKRKRVLWYQF